MAQDFPWFPEKVSLNPITGLEELDSVSPSFGAAFNASFAREYTLAPGIERVSKGEPFLEETFPAVEGYNPIDDTEIGGYDPTQFVGSKSPQETIQLRDKIDRSRELDADAQGGGALLGGISGAVGNPVLLGTAVATGGMSVVPSVLTMAGGEIVNEAILHSQNPTRTIAESAVNVGLVAGLEGVGKLVFGRSRPQIAKDLSEPPTPMKAAQGDAGAALARDVVDLSQPVSVPKAWMVKMLGGTKASPAADVVVNSATDEAKQLIREMVEVSIRVEGKATTPAESLIKEADGLSSEMNRVFEMQYKDYLDKGGKLSDEQFLDMVATAMRNGDDFASIPQVQSVSRAFRKVDDDLFTRAKGVELYGKDGPAPLQGSRNHLQRIYQRLGIMADRAGFKKVILRNLGKNENFLIRLKGVDGADDTLAAVSPKDWPNMQAEYGSQVEIAVGASLDDVSESIISNIMGNGQIMDFAGIEHSVPKAGSLQERTLGFIPDEELRPWLENNALAVMNITARQMTRDITMKQKFSGSALKDEIDTVRKAYAKKMNEAKPKDVKKLQARLDKDLVVIKGLRDQLLGTYGRPDDPTSWLVQSGRMIKMATLLSSGLNIPLSSIPDMVAPALRHGFKPFYKGFKVMASGKGKAYKKYVKTLGIATELTTNARMMSFANTVFAKPWEKKWNRRFGKGTGLSYQTDFFQALNAVSTSDMFLGWMRQGSKLKEGNRLKMLDMGIDDKWSKRIMKQVDEFGDKSGGITLPESYKWSDKAAAQVFESALRKEVTTTTLVPGIGDVPLVMRTEAGGFITMFLSFTTSAHNKFLIAGLQRADADFLTGVLLMTVAGGLTTAAKDATRGVDYTDKDIDQMFMDAVDRGGTAAWMMPPVNLARKFLMGQAPSRYEARRGITGSLSTATLGFATDVVQSSYGVLAEGNTDDAFRLLKRVPFANSFHAVDLLQTFTDNR